ncbi:RING-H2 finger protein ATL39-like [Nymphaea colorata]|nr:RING-H2 finger protein ATL39-like [Nymphaea colorata]
MNSEPSVPFKHGRYLKQLDCQIAVHVTIISSSAPAAPTASCSYLPRPRFGVYLGIVLASILAGAILYLLANSIRDCLRRRNQPRESCSFPTSGGDELGFIPTRVVHGSGEGAFNEDCVICLSEFEEGETIRDLPKCGHAFHKDCLDRWLHSNCASAPMCPICRSQVMQRNDYGVGQTEDRGGEDSSLGIPLAMLANSRHLVLM